MSAHPPPAIRAESRNGLARIVRSLAPPAILLCLLLLGTPAFGAPVVLENGDWRVAVDPVSLALRVRTAGGKEEIQVSTGVGPHSVSVLQSDAGEAHWSWDDGAYRLVARLSGRDLHLAITARAAGALAILDQPGAATGRGLILPIAEGHYAPSGSSVWSDFLSGRLSTVDTTEDLSLPLWGMDHGDRSLHWILANPFDNQLHFIAGPDGGVGLQLTHRFTALAPGDPMTLILHLDGPDLLAGARRYRALLIEQGAYESLASKLASEPATAGLLGATHLYLWGGGLFGAKDVIDWPSFLSRLRSSTGLAARIAAGFGKDDKNLLASAPSKPEPYQRAALVRAVDAALDDMARRRWQTGDADAGRLVAAYRDLRLEAQSAFAGALASDPRTWGDTVSVATIDRLAAAGLDRLWIGLGQGWEAGLWHPEAIAAAKAHHYLIAPYDEYETAVAPGERPDWATANLGAAAYRDCGIVLADGSLKTGFGKAGRYTNPACVRSLLEARVSAIEQAAGFNSWFIDSYASGMLFDDFRPNAAMTMAREADENAAAAAWIARAIGGPVGSEDGNAVTARGIAFAHGMQTPVIGWGDPDLQHDPSSPYFLGNWWPPEQPTLFFKPVPMKEPYATIYFDPRFRLPLYQAVFHGSVITTQHWLFDNLKLSNVRVENALAQLLYNVPPLYNLSEGSFGARIGTIVAQERFFRPLHARLATQALTAFAWLTPDRLVQQTSFSDGTRLIANFGTTPFRDDAVSVAPRSIMAVVPGQAPLSFAPRP